MIIDISRTLFPGIAVWPGDSAFERQTMLSRAEGASVNLSTLTLSAHTGSHVDAPFHFQNEGATVEALDLAPFWGPAQVVTVGRQDGPLGPEDFAGWDLRRAPRLLVHSPASALDPALFPEQFVYPGAGLAAFMAEQGIILFGTDAPSMDAADDEVLPGHNALQRHGIAILEGLDLSRAPDGLYELVALPLKIDGCDGSPVRAALRPI